MSAIDALSIIVHNITLDELKMLRSKNKKLEKMMKSLQEDLKTRMNYYDACVSMARTQPHDPQCRTDSIKNQLGDDYDKELERLQEEDSDWYHGFNSGMLASTRLYLDLSEYEDSTIEGDDGEENYPVEEIWEQAKEEFPFLDT